MFPFLRNNSANYKGKKVESADIWLLNGPNVADW